MSNLDSKGRAKRRHASNGVFEWGILRWWLPLSRRLDGSDPAADQSQNRYLATLVGWG